MPAQKRPSFVWFLLLVCLGVYASFFKIQWENKILKKVVQRLEADSRVAEAIVSEIVFDENKQPVKTTIKFVEYSSDGKPLEPKFFTFHGNLIQFQALVIRFDDVKIRNADLLKGKSAYLFWKVFRLDGANTEEFEINQINEVPTGYQVGGEKNVFEKTLWKNFWSYALEEKSAGNDVKNAQVEAPGTKFWPGYLYTLKIEHDGGLRIDASQISSILTE